MQEVFDHLEAYGLIKEGHIARRLGRMSNQQLDEFLESYAESAKRRAPTLRAAVGETDIYPDSYADTLPISTIRQLALYANRIYLHDPLLDLLGEWQGLDFMPFLLLQHPNRADRLARFRSMATDRIESLLTLRPLASAAILHLIPTRFVHNERHPRALYADNLFGPGGSLEEIQDESEKAQAKERGGDGSTVPEAVQTYCSERIWVAPVRWEDNRPVPAIDEPLTPTHTIALGLDGDPFVQFAPFFRIMGIEEDADGGTFEGFYDIGDSEPLAPELFWPWVRSTASQYVVNRVRRLQTDLALASASRAQFLTDLVVSRDLASLNLSRQRSGDSDGVEGGGMSSSSSRAVAAILGMDIPYLDNVSLADVVRARQDEAAFEDWRRAVADAFDAIRTLPGSADFQDHADQAWGDLTRAPLAKVDRKVRALKRNLGLDAAILVGSLASYILTHENSLVAAAATLALVYGGTEAVKQYKQDKAEEDKLREMPSFFFWQATHGARAAHKRARPRKDE